ncbi:MAG TPA: hypothetical protein GYA07_03770 [Verrucomicrobia bacterium]|nr:hypothetical protein [Verrucomicrobiota bacterium]HOB31315.1 hypothetical protein [Verrucomicrobiota bacterium]HOP96875.1 hypothetical protein [Verrucomicrobiota bacterium]
MCSFARTAHGLATEQLGPDTPERPTVAQSGWHKGIVEVPRHPSRVYSVWVNGNENFCFNARPEQMNELIELFSKARLRDHEIRIKPGTNTVKSLRGDVIRYNVSLQILDGIALHASRERNDAETLEPVLTIYIGADRSLLSQLKFPEHVVVECAVEGVEIKRRAKPDRKAWYGRLRLTGGGSPVDFQTGISTRITWWDKTSPEGIPLARVGTDSTFKVVLSEAELALLREGASWLTVTTGNFTSEPKSSDPRFPAAALAADEDRAVAQAFSIPDHFYYGRILFEDGSPPVLNPEPWADAEVHVDFPYAGMFHPDAEGYFKLYLEPEQLAALKEQRPGMNIYVPLKEPGRSRAIAEFPAGLLSQDKTEAGVVKIPKPDYR